MRYEAFIHEVQKRARLSTQSDAVGAIRATLMTLGERLSADEVKDLAAQLTREIAFFLEEGGKYAAGKPTYDEFVCRIADRAGVSPQVALFRARVVLEVLGEAVTIGEMADVRAQLPHTFAPLFQALNS